MRYGTLSGQLSLFAWALSMICSSVSISSGQSTDFRVETDVSLPGNPKPIQQTLTLFKSGVAYDFSRDEPDQITLLDPTRQRIVLLDAKRQVQLSIDMAEFNAFMASAQNQAAASNLSVYLDDAKNVSFDEDKNSVTVGASVLRYEATLQEPSEAKMVQTYAKFADISSQLNAWRASSPPPFARKALNAEIAQRGALPKEITRTTFVRDGAQVTENVVECRLHSNWRLSRDDETLIGKFGEMLANFKQVSVGEFFQKPKAVAEKASAPAR